MSTWLIITIIIAAIYFSGVLYASYQIPNAVSTYNASPAGAQISSSNMWYSWFGLATVTQPVAAGTTSTPA